jgi:hypothetical protein
MRKVISVAIALGALAVATAPAGATHGGFHPTFREERVYFHCGGGTKVKNVDYNQGGLAPWDTTAPAQSVQDGAGCGVIDPSALRNTQPTGGGADGAFGGLYTGNLQNMTVEMWMLGHSPGNVTTNTVNVTPWLVIDGEPYVADTTTLTSVPLVETNDGMTRKIEFTITGLGTVKEVLDDQGNVVDVTTTGLARPSAVGEHDIQLNVRVRGDTAVGAVWVWDTTEVPAGITFNDPTPAGKKQPATIPAS